MVHTDIVLFDIASTLDNPISAHGWQVRMIMNYKYLNFKTQFVSGTQIESTCKPLGILPTGVKPNGKPHYTLPAILDRTDPTNPVALADSIPIINYLEKTYPCDAHYTAFPPGTRALQVLFKQFVVLDIICIIKSIAINAHMASKVEEDRVDFQQRMERVFGKAFEQIEKKGAEREAAYVELERIFGQIADAIDANGDGGQFFMGESVVCADFALAGCMMLIKCLSPDDVFVRLRGWHGGRWAHYFDAFAPWMALNSPPTR